MKCPYCNFMRSTLYLIFVFGVIRLMRSYFEEINFWSLSGEEWAQNPELFRIISWSRRIDQKCKNPNYCYDLFVCLLVSKSKILTSPPAVCSK